MMQLWTGLHAAGKQIQKLEKVAGLSREADVTAAGAEKGEAAGHALLRRYSSRVAECLQPEGVPVKHLPRAGRCLMICLDIRNNIPLLLSSDWPPLPDSSAVAIIRAD